MTCKDCKRRFKCSYLEKSYKPSEDGDSWANWCDAFETKHKTRKVFKDGFVVIQSGYNWHIQIYDTSFFRTSSLLIPKMVFHASCTKRKSKRQLRKMVDLYKRLLALNKAVE